MMKTVSDYNILHEIVIQLDSYNNVYFAAFTVGFELGVYNIHEAVGFQAVCISLSGDLDGINATITVMSSTDGATAQGKWQTSLDHTTKDTFCAM